jgi:Putative prokaryotic signal transducing protein
MVELRRSNDLVYLSWARAVLHAAGIDTVLLDANVSSVEGSIGAIPRRLMAAEENAGRAQDVLSRAEAEIAEVPVENAGDDGA